MATHMNKLGTIATWASNAFKSNTEGSAKAPDNKAKTSSAIVERPDISNIDCVGAAVAVPRLKQALRSFPHNEFDLEKVAKSLKLSAAIGDGACVGLSLTWLEGVMQRPNKSPINKNGCLVTNDGLQTAFAIQRNYVGEHAKALATLGNLSPEAVSRAATQALFNEHGLNAATVSGGLDEEHLASLIATPGHYIIALTGFNDGHCLAATTLPAHEHEPRITVFDPEAGEFKMHTEEAEYFLTALNARYKTVGWNYSGMDVFSLRANIQAADRG
ncbi:hypothetical protein A7J50_5988 (plasmid) [Pseudomonas antarctica]|uniref:Peptidase C58 YopT-type domain-containing protein n=2 Tax=Pseudomonas antarctica TaxID=219572 RepID=A0A172Z9V3_9PSED|nr:hypothetical protein A7J50_5988 [Pseudomonas antarctica]